MTSRPPTAKVLPSGPNATPYPPGLRVAGFLTEATSHSLTDPPPAEARVLPSGLNLTEEAQGTWKVAVFFPLAASHNFSSAARVLPLVPSVVSPPEARVFPSGLKATAE